MPRIDVMSLTKAWTSRDGFDLDRSCDSLAIKQGCLETWTLLGRDDMLVPDWQIRQVRSNSRLRSQRAKELCLTRNKRLLVYG